MRTMFGEYTPADEEVKRNRRLFVTSVLLVLLNFGIIGPLLRYGKDFLVALKPAYDVEYLMEHGAKDGMHVSGQIPYTYDNFATMENSVNGRVNACYYALPADNGMLILNVSVERNAEMEGLLEETMDFLETGTWPASLVMVEGYVEKAKGRLPYLLTQYMADIGYTQEEIGAMGDPLMIVDATEDIQKARLYVPLAVILGALEVLVIVFVVLRKCRK